MNQKEQLIKYFNENFSITTLECMQKLMILDLQGIIRDLKDDGHMFVEPTKIVKGKNKFGTPCTWAEYQYLGMKNKENR